MKQTCLPHDHCQETRHVLEHLPGQAQFQMTAEQFRLLSDGSRLQLFWLLCHCRECVINIAAMMNMSSPAVSHHLRQLKSAGLIESHREGKEVYYQAVDTPAARSLHDAMENLMAVTCPVNG